MADLEVSPIGIGAWSWGDRSSYWGNDLTSPARKAENLEAYTALVDNGVGLIDTAEVYGFGLSEEFIGDFMRQTNTRPAIATKFAPLPWRFTSGSVVDACKASIGRLGVDKLALYQIHWPAFATNFWCNDAFVQGLADCQVQGLTQAVGVSNFKADRVRQAARVLQDNGVPLASNQVQYSLLYREPERNGVADAVREAGSTLIAYSPLNQGLLTGKYTKDNLPGGARALVINQERVAAVQPLLSLMRDIGGAHGGKTPGQVAINWCICKGAVPIPGAKNARQAKEAAGGFGWRMSDDEVAALDAASDKVPESTGAPFEKW
jgi:aryl-alcohol dehydrogenase-like predicted oxidoreductase